MIRKSINSAELFSFVKTSTNIFYNKITTSYSLNEIKNSFIKSHHDRTILKLENYPQTYINPNTTTALHTLKAADGYLGIKSGVECSINPLENLLIEEITPVDLSTKLILTKSNDDFSGLHEIKIADIAIQEDLDTHTLVGDELDTENKIKFDFIDTNYFGASDFKLKIPMYDHKEFKLTSYTNNCVFSPADIPPDLDGEGGVDAVIGIKSVSFSVASCPLNSSTLADLARSTGKTIIKKANTLQNPDYLCFSEIQVPKLRYQFSSNICPNLSSFWSGDVVTLDSTALDTNSFGTQTIELTGLWPGHCALATSIPTNLLRHSATTNVEILNSDTSYLPLKINPDGSYGQLTINDKTITDEYLAHGNHYVTSLSVSVPPVFNSREIEVGDLLASFGDLCHSFTVVADTAIKNQFTIDLKKLADYYEDKQASATFTIKNDLSIEAKENLDTTISSATGIIIPTRRNFTGNLPGLSDIEVTIPKVNLSPTPIVDLTDSHVISLLVNTNINSNAWKFETITEKDRTFESGYSWTGDLLIPYSFAGDTNFVVINESAGSSSVEIPLDKFSYAFIVNKDSSTMNTCASCGKSFNPTWYCDTYSADSNSLKLNLSIKNSLIDPADSWNEISYKTIEFEHPIIWDCFIGHLCESCLKEHSKIYYHHTIADTDLKYNYVQIRPNYQVPKITFKPGSVSEIQVTSKDYDSINNEILQVTLPNEYLNAIFKIDIAY